MSVETFATLVLVFGALIILLQTMAIIAWWRRGSQYARLEIARREQMTRGELAALSKSPPLSRNGKFTDWDVQDDVDDPPSTENPQIK